MLTHGSTYVFDYHWQEQTNSGATVPGQSLVTECLEPQVLGLSTVVLKTKQQNKKPAAVLLMFSVFFHISEIFGLKNKVTNGVVKLKWRYSVIQHLTGDF